VVNDVAHELDLRNGGSGKKINANKFIFNQCHQLKQICNNN